MTPSGQLDIITRSADDYFSTSPFVYELKPSDFDGMAAHHLKNHKCSFVLFYAPWCGYCKDLGKKINMSSGKSTWEEVGEMAAFFDVCALNCEKYNDYVQKIKTEAPNLITSYPSLIVYNQGKPVKKHEGERTTQELVSVCLKACGIN